MRVSRMAQARIDAEHILTVLREIHTFSADMGREVERVEDLGIPLARMISGGLVATVTPEGAEMLSDVARVLSLILDRGIPTLQDAEPHVTILEYVPFGHSEPCPVMVMGVEGFMLRVTVPDSLIESKWRLNMTDDSVLRTLRIVDQSK